MNLTGYFKRPRKVNVQPSMSPLVREQILKNQEGVLDVMSKNIKEGNRSCPFLMGSPCLGEFCMHFQKFNSLDRKTGQSQEYWVCAHTQQNSLLIELNQNIRELINLKKGEAHA